MIVAGHHPLPSVHLMSHVTACDPISQALPLVLLAIKDWRWEWPGNKATIYQNASYLRLKN